MTSTTNYFNPDAAKPDFGGNTILSAFHAPEQMDRYRQMMGLQEQMAQLSLARQGMENRTYELDAPVREAGRAPAISGFQLKDMVNQGAMKTPGYAEEMARGEMGKARQEFERGESLRDTRPGASARTNVENFASAMEHAAYSLQMMAASNPTIAQAEWQQMIGRFPEQIRNHLPQQYNPQVPQQLTKFAEAARNSMGHQRNRDITGMQTGSAEKIARGNNQTSENVANINADARIEAAWARMGGSAAKHKVEAVIERYLSKVMDNQETTPAEDKAFMAAQQVMMNVRAAAGLPMDSNMLNWQLLFGNKTPPGRPVPGVVPPPNPQAGGQPGQSGPQPGTRENPIILK